MWTLAEVEHREVRETLKRSNERTLTSRVLQARGSRPEHTHAPDQKKPGPTGCLLGQSGTCSPRATFSADSRKNPS